MLGSIFSAWCVLALELETWKVVVKVVGILQKISGFVAIYGLMILYVATHDLLENWRTTSKFVAIKVVVLLCTFQEMCGGPANAQPLLKTTCLLRSTAFVVRGGFPQLLVVLFLRGSLRTPNRAL